MGLDRAYTFDDLLILPKYSSLERNEIDIHSVFYGHNLSVPIMSSPMDTITEAQMMQAIYNAGGFGFHHRYTKMGVLYAARNIPGGIAVSPSMNMNNIEWLFDGIDKSPIVILDVAHGHHKRNLDYCKMLIESGITVISGNVVDPQAVEDYLKIGVHDFRVGIGSGSVCTTRTVAGIGMPQASAIRTIRKCFPDNIRIISDGGHKTTADIVKALALGADYVMLGNMLKGCNEVPELGKKEYRGMASRDARDSIGKLDTIPEGITKSIKPTGRFVADILKEIKDAIELACYYVGAWNLRELREKAEIIVVTENGRREGDKSSY